MKKILLLATMAASLAGVTAYGQGNFIFGTGAGYVWNDTTATPARGGNFNVSFLYGSGSTLISQAAAFTPTNNALTGTVSLGASSTDEWSKILSDPNYTLAVNSSSGQVVVGTLSGTGGVVYNGGGNFLVQGTSASGGTVNVYMIAWDNAYATPALAAAAGSSLGWSLPFAYTYAANPGAAGGNFSAAAVTAGVGAQFGVLPVPEPSTFALTGLGAAAMLIFRRRK